MIPVHPWLNALPTEQPGWALAQWLNDPTAPPRRTAQRWIQQWLTGGAIAASGYGRTRRYWRHTATPSSAVPAPLLSSSPVPASLASDITAPEWTSLIPLSADSADILAYVCQPLSARKPVGYQPHLLHDYRPGQDHYLSAPLRAQLRHLGQTAQVDQPAGTYSRAILGRLLIDLSWASSHLEGNTYSRLDTRELIAHGTAAQGKAALETQMILNHKTAIELLVDNIDSAGYDRFTLLNLHSALAENLLPNPADEGRLRQHAVDIAHSVYRPLSFPAHISEALDTMLARLNAIADPLEQAFFAMVHLPYLQPFADINKRTSRLMANLPLFKANLCPLTFLDVPQAAYSMAMLGVYELGRVELLRDLFVWAYERSTQEYVAIRQTLAQPDPLRLAWRTLIRDTLQAVVTQPQLDALALIIEAVASQVPAQQQNQVQTLIVEELRRLHEGVLSRYGLRPAQYHAWKNHRPSHR